MANWWPAKTNPNHRAFTLFAQTCSSSLWELGRGAEPPSGGMTFTAAVLHLSPLGAQESVREAVPSLAHTGTGRTPRPQPTDSSILRAPPPPPRRGDPPQPTPLSGAGTAASAAPRTRTPGPLRPPRPRTAAPASRCAARGPSRRPARQRRVAARRGPAPTRRARSALLLLLALLLGTIVGAEPGRAVPVLGLGGQLAVQVLLPLLRPPHARHVTAAAPPRAHGASRGERRGRRHALWCARGTPGRRRTRPGGRQGADPPPRTRVAAGMRARAREGEAGPAGQGPLPSARSDKKWKGEIS